MPEARIGMIVDYGRGPANRSRNRTKSAATLYHGWVATAKRVCTTDDAGWLMEGRCAVKYATSFVSNIKGVKRTLQKRPLLALHECGTLARNISRRLSTQRAAAVL